jgi:3-oxoacyl-[acyl-carrier-protein] synthase-3
MITPSGNWKGAAGGRIAGVVASVPSTVWTNADLPPGADEAARVTGVRERRRVVQGQSAESLCIDAAQRLLTSLRWAPESIDQMILITETPSQRIPAPAYNVHRELGLARHCTLMEINYSCVGYVVGLWNAMQMLEGRTRGRSLLLVGDTFSKALDPQDRATGPLFGDAGSATAIEVSLCSQVFVLGISGTNNHKLSQANGEFLKMDGAAVFNFTLDEVPPLVAETLQIGRPDYILFHQANRFMLDHLITKCKLRDQPGGYAAEQIPINVEKWGNTSCASIPLLLADKIGARAADKRVAAFGFGAGWAWGGAMLNLEGMQVCELIESLPPQSASLVNGAL